jgi:alcohol dehydrogenase class IV
MNPYSYPNMSYELVAPRQIVFGWGRRREVGALARTLGKRALVIVGTRTLRSQGLLGEILGHLQAGGVTAVEIATIEHEPEVADVDRAAQAVRQQQVAAGDFLLAIGGGSAIDLAKAVAAMATNRDSATVRDYLENVGRGLKLLQPPLPVMAMPTTAGTGAEATRNAVISSYDPPFKKSLRDTRMMPQIALVDPELCVSVPAKITAASGMDAITQLFESYISRKAQPIPQALAVQGLRLAVPAIVEAVENGTSRPAREAMSHAALLSGMALANAGLGMAHGVAPALGTHCRVPHGLACAVMLPVALRVNSQVRQLELARLSHLLFGHSSRRSPAEAVDALIYEIQQLCERVGVPQRLSALGVKAQQIPALVKDSRGSSMSGNPRELGDDELTAILEQML